MKIYDTCICELLDLIVMVIDRYVELFGGWIDKENLKLKLWNYGKK